MENVKDSARNGGRIEYIDAMRGLAMFMVIISHVGGWGTNVGNVFSYKVFFDHYVMLPLFFFICGFVFYREGQRWTILAVWYFIKAKLLYFIVSPLLFAVLLGGYVIGNDLNRIIFDTSKCGYWFTYSLLQYYILHIICNSTCRLFKLRSTTTDIVSFLFAFAIFSACIIAGLLNCVCQSDDIFSIMHLNTYPFFIFGILVRKHFPKCQLMLDTNWFTFVIVLLFIVFNILPNFSSNMKFIVCGFCGVIIVFDLFRKNNKMFSQETTTGKVFQFVGRRTLDIYFIHYFFVFSNLQNVLPDFSQLNSPLMEFAVTFSISCLIVIMSLLVSAVLRVSPVMGHFLFGAKIKKT